jgi:hypothetical protein
LLRNEGERRRLAEAGRDHVRSNFLLPRLLRRTDAGPWVAGGTCPASEGP